MLNNQNNKIVSISDSNNNSYVEDNMIYSVFNNNEKVLNESMASSIVNVKEKKFSIENVASTIYNAMIGNNTSSTKINENVSNKQNNNLFNNVDNITMDIDNSTRINNKENNGGKKTEIFKEIRFLGDGKNGEFALPALDANEYMGEVQYKGAKTAGNLLVVGYGCLPRVVEKQTLCEVLYLAYADDVEGSIFPIKGDSGAPVYKNNVLHSFHKGEFGDKYHLLTPCHLALKQAETLLQNSQLLNDDSKLTFCTF
jgi:hypothetical protein